jgi:hypothetical protein
MEGGPVDVVLLRRAYALRNAGLAIAAAGALLGLSLTGESRILWLMALLFSGGIMAMLGIEGTPRRVAGRLDALGVRVADRVVARRRSFRVGWIERDGERTCVYVQGFLPPLRLEAKDVADARRLLRLLGLDRSQTVLRFPTFSAPALGQFVMQVVLQPGFLGFRLWGLTWTHTALAILIVIALLLATSLGLHGETIVGGDGVLFARMASPQVRIAIERVAARRPARSERFGDTPPAIGVGMADEDDGQLTAAMARVRDG